MISMTYQFSELAAVAEQILTQTPTRIFTLKGEIGAGKTTLVAAFAAFLGAKDAVSSPTFPIINQYECVDNQRIFHLDLYRLKNQQEAIDIGIEDVLYDSAAYIFIEWHETIADLLPQNTVHLEMNVIDVHTRKIVVFTLGMR